MTRLVYRTVDVVPDEADRASLASHMFALMLRNIATDGFVFADPVTPGVLSSPGCVIASPSYPGDLAAINQDYVYNWTRDAAVTAMELAAAPQDTAQLLNNYVSFARICQRAEAPVHRACYRIDGAARDWSNQSDGPALRAAAVLQAWSQLDEDAQGTAREVLATDVAFLLSEYRHDTCSLWEEREGASFFARSVQLKCLLDIRSNTAGISAPPEIDEAISWLEERVPEHWDGARYLSVLPPQEGYDPNIDVVLAALYGALPCTDPRLLATAAQIRAQWSDPNEPTCYEINNKDRPLGVGPLLGRYPMDTYDGDTRDRFVGHPWALCTTGFAELYFRVAETAAREGTLPDDPLAVRFLEQVGVSGETPLSAAVDALRDAGDRMVRAVITHSDHLELSEQFDAVTGFEKSVRDLTWSYSSFLSALRARHALAQVHVG